MYYSTSDAEFMKELQRHAKAIVSNGGGFITLSKDEYAQAKRIAKTADVFRRKWFKLYYAGVLLKEQK